MTDLTLNNGYKMPSLGLGTWNSDPGLVGEAVKYALNLGYRHIDAASIYGNEKEIGDTLKETFSNGIKRQDIFITSKLWNTDHKSENVLKACEKSLHDLGLEYLDLYLVHWAMPFITGHGVEPLDKEGNIMLDNIPMQETWKAMEDLLEKGLVKSIGVANFTTGMLIDLLTYANIKPAVNQIELHAYNNQEKLVKYCQRLGIQITAYSPLGTPAASPDGYPILLEDETLKTIANKYNKTTAQILLRWAVQRGTIAIPKSTNPQRIKENFEIFSFDIAKNDMQTINELNRNLRYVDPYDWYKLPYFD